MQPFVLVGATFAAEEKYIFAFYACSCSERKYIGFMQCLLSCPYAGLMNMVKFIASSIVNSSSGHVRS